MTIWKQKLPSASEASHIKLSLTIITIIVRVLISTLTLLST